MRLTIGRAKRKWRNKWINLSIFCLTVFFHFCSFFSEHTCIELVAGQHLQWYEWEDDCCVEIVTNSCFDILIDKQSEMAITTSHQWWQRLLLFVFFDWFFWTLALRHIIQMIVWLDKHAPAYWFRIWNLLSQNISRLNSSVIIYNNIGIILLLSCIISRMFCHSG